MPISCVSSYCGVCITISPATQESRVKLYAYTLRRPSQTVQFPNIYVSKWQFIRTIAFPNITSQSCLKPLHINAPIQIRSQFTCRKHASTHTAVSSSDRICKQRIRLLKIAEAWQKTKKNFLFVLPNEHEDWQQTKKRKFHRIHRHKNNIYKIFSIFLDFIIMCIGVHMMCLMGLSENITFWIIQNTSRAHCLTIIPMQVCWKFEAQSHYLIPCRLNSCWIPHTRQPRDQKRIL